MSRRHRVMRTPLGRAALVVVSSVAVLALAGCGAGQVTQTDTQVAAVNGASADIKGIAIRDALLAYPEQSSSDGSYPKGSDVPVRLTIVNDGPVADTLVAVRSPAATQVLVQGRTSIPAGTSVVSVTDDAGSARSAAPASAQPPSPLDAGELRIVLSNTTRELRAGLNTPITLVFQHAGEVTLPVPMGAPTHGGREAQGESGGHS